MLSDFIVKRAHIGQKCGVIHTHRAFRQQPVRKTAVAYFAMRPWTDSRIDKETVLSAQLNKFSKIALTCPVELSLNLFVMDPKNISRNNLNSPRFHFQNLFFPILLRIAAIVKLPHHGQPWRAVKHQVTTIHRNGATTRRLTGIAAPHIEITCFRRCDGLACIDCKESALSRG